MKKFFLPTVIICVLVLAALSIITGFWDNAPKINVTRVGFVYSEDESTPYTANFVKAQRALEDEYGDRVQVLVKSNVLSRESEQPMRELIRDGVKILFINMDTDIPITLAREFPDVQFCQVSLPTISMDGTPDNYHTFNGEIYQARYISGIAAGMKLRQLLDSGALLPRDALVGYVGANASTEVISGYTAFLLGVRSVAPEATMRVRYTGSWSNYAAEKEQTRELIEEGCVIIAQHVNTTAPAVACEEAASAGKTVYHVGYHQSMMDIAPSCALASIRTNWAPYVIQAVQAVMSGTSIENTVEAHEHGRDLSAGFESGWVELLELNKFIAAEGTQEKIDNAIEGLKKGKIRVFSGNYTGVNPLNASDTIDLNEGFTENQYSSNPSFGYILKDYITVEN
ncbi:BMP family ABC transporter substrate-binding protein [Aristaeella lactis]|uniref:Basic membrane protein A n=1 Tax=Aristaeella lactis TaxID=3046383 RepID=A0AC61PQ65_9FIRM|nr:BMP family ABC transporter substrate-binding protein [Aristaeella lactis]QUA54235.1 BMP family ABC transporter substrate-binding protein [Aristaeella lactis]SMC88175.1 basic membrane protein A [Aristaeella lactis]